MRWWWSLIAGAVLLYFFLRAIRRIRRTTLDLRGKLVIVTGASSGIGDEIATQVSKRCAGAHMLLVARNAESLRTVAQKCTKAGAASVDILSIDITDEVARQQLRSALASRREPLGMVVLNAGRGAIASFDSSDDTLRIARELMEINYFANVALVQILLSRIHSDKTQLLVISSLSGVLATPQRTQYCASKFALQGFCSALRMELKPRGAGLTVVCPGFVATPFHHRLATAKDSAVPERKGKFMTAEKCASIAVEAALTRDDEVILTTSGWLGYHLRPWLPRVVDAFAVRKAASSLK